MRIRRPWLVLVAVLMPSVTHAHDHFADLYGAASLMFGSAHPGLHVSFSKTLPQVEEAAAADVVKRLTFVGDFSAHWEAGEGDRRNVNYLGGLRYTFAKTAHSSKLPFVHLMLGGVHTKSAGQGDGDAALALGGGFEYIPSGSPGGFGFRVQADYIVRPGDVQPRVSAGIVWRKE